MRWCGWTPLVVVGVGIAATFFLRPVPAPDAVFLIVVDTLRPDRLSCYGCATHTTRHIDRLASMGVKFTRAQSVASWTRPSVGAILTSLYPTQLGLTEVPAGPGRTFQWRERRKQQSYAIPPHAKTLGEMLSNGGFRTAAFVDQPGLNSNKGYQRGFDEWYYPTGLDIIERHDSDHTFSPQVWPSTKYAYQSDLALVREFDSWLSEHGKEKVFVWLHLLTPHRPYSPPAEYAPTPSPTDGSKPTPSQRYDGEVRAVDDMIGLTMDAIERHVGLNRSLIVFTSDHGEEFGEHGMSEHGHSLHREVIRVPLLIAAPSIPRGRTIDDYVRLIDILPTTLGITGMASAAPSTLQGTDLLPIITGEEAHLPVFSEAMLYGSTERSLIEHGFKLMYDEQGEQYRLFDVVADSQEAIDVADKHEPRFRSMQENLRTLHDRLQDDHQRWRRAASERIISREKEELEQLRALEALRALGYVGDE